MPRRRARGERAHSARPRAGRDDVARPGSASEPLVSNDDGRAQASAAAARLVAARVDAPLVWCDSIECNAMQCGLWNVTNVMPLAWCEAPLSSMEWNGMEWNGMEWNGMEWNGMECSCGARLLPLLCLRRGAQKECGEEVVWRALRRSKHARMQLLSVVILQYSAVQYSTVQYSTAPHRTAQHSTAQHSTAQHSTAQHSTVHCMQLLSFGRRAARSRRRRQVEP